jgi:hypothetical protein
MSTARLAVRALAAFFIFGTCASGFSFLTLLAPGTALDVLWRVNPTGHSALRQAAEWGIALMGIVSLVCALTARGLWLRRRWGYRLAIAMLAANLLGDVFNAFVLGDRRTLIGLPIAGALIAYLLTPAVRSVFRGEPGLPPHEAAG